MSPPDNERRPAGKRSAEDRPGRKITHIVSNDVERCPLACSPSCSFRCPVSIGDAVDVSLRAGTLVKS